MCDHNHGGVCDSGHSHDDELELGVQYSLYQKIDLDQLTCLNETVEDSGKTIFKPWDQRLDRAEFVTSDADEELLFNIPFTGTVKLKGIIVIGGEHGSHPSFMRLYKDKPQMTFDDVGAEPVQEFELTRDETGTVEYGVKIVKFSNISHLSIHFPSNFGGADSTKIFYIGLRGEFQAPFRREAVICTYESRPVPQDHKGEIPEATQYGVF